MHHERADDVAYPSQLIPGGWNTFAFFFLVVVVVCERLDFLLGATSETRAPLRTGVGQGKDSRARFQPGDISRTTAR